MDDHTFLADWCEENNGCPVHGGRVKKMYRFGQYEDASVVVFCGCGCAVCINEASLQIGPATGTEYTYHARYGSAAGRATLIKMKEAVDNAPFV